MKNIQDMISLVQQLPHRVHSNPPLPPHEPTSDSSHSADQASAHFQERMDRGSRSRHAGQSRQEPQDVSIRYMSDEQITSVKVDRQARWANPFISHAMPIILMARKYRLNGQLNRQEVRSLLVHEVKVFRERLSARGCESEQISDASYLLCTFMDEFVSDFARDRHETAYLEDRSLLVEFHGDAWGGEDAFLDLERWMTTHPLPIPILAFYELVLSLGWQGRYRIRDRGIVLLNDLRTQLHSLIWGHAHLLPMGSSLLLSPVSRASKWSLRNKMMAVTLVLALGYVLSVFLLDLLGRPIRSALAAWEPPVRTINLAERLPSPLPELLGEGWLSAYKHPAGWLLVFRSDGAFDVGQADFKPSFINNIARVGLALAPWPGDLEVIGHTDSQPIQSRVFPNNRVLSEARARTAAKSLAEYVTQQGSRAPSLVVDRQILATGRGDSEPVDKSSTPVAFERNRRVDVLWKVTPRATLASQNEPQGPPFSGESPLPLQRDQLRERP